MHKRESPVITVLDARPMSEISFRGTPPTSPGATSPGLTKKPTDNGHVTRSETEGAPLKRQSSAPKRPGPPSRPPSIYQTQSHKSAGKQDTTTPPSEHKSVDPPSYKPDGDHQPRPAPRATRPTPEGAESTNTVVDGGMTSSSSQYGQYGQPSSMNPHSNVQFRKPPLGGTPPPLPSKSPSMGNLTMVGLPSNDEPAAATQPKPKPRPTPSPRKSVYRNSASMENVSTISIAPSSEPEEAQPQPAPSQVRKPTIIRPGSTKPSSSFTRSSVYKHDKGENDNNTQGMNKEGDGDPSSTGSVFGVKLKSTVAKEPDHTTEDKQTEKPADEKSTPVAAAAAPAAAAPSSAPGWATGGDKKPPPVKPKPALLPKPALKPKPGSVRVRSSVHEPVAADTSSISRRRSFHGVSQHSTEHDNEARVETKSTPAWMPKLKPAVLPNTDKVAEDRKPVSSEETYKKPGPSPMRATYRPTIIRATGSRPTTQREEEKENEKPIPSVGQIPEKEQKNVVEDVQESQAASRPTPDVAPKRQPATKRKPTIIRTKSISKEDAVTPQEAPRNSTQSMRGAMSMPNITQPAQLSVKSPVVTETSPIHKSSSQEEMDNSVNENLETNQPVRQPSKRPPVQVTSGQDDLDVPFPINYDTKPMTKKVPPAKPPPPRPTSGPKKSVSTSDENISSKQSPPPRPGPAPAKPSRSRPMSMPPNYSHHVQGGMPPKLPGRPGPGHPLHHYMVSTPRGVALFDFSASQPDELSVQTGDVVELLKWVDDEWIYAKSAKKQGMLPLAFLDIVEPLPKSAQHYDAGSSHKTGADHPDAGHVNGPHCLARFDYEGEEAEDLKFKAGEVIKLLERLGDNWLKGELKGRTGIFPVEFVEIVVNLPEVTRAGSVSSLSSTEGDSSRTSTAVYAFTGEQGDLSFEIGDRIQVLSRVNQDWLHGELRGKRGSFPAGFIDHIPTNLPDHREADNQGQPASPRPHTPGQGTAFCVAVYPFKGENRGDLSFEKGDRILLLGKESADWLRGSLGGREGVFPKDFVTLEGEETGRRLSSVSSERSSGSTQSIPGTDHPKQVPCAEALYDFAGEVDDDLSFRIGDRIELVSAQNDWLTGRLRGKQGTFPAAFVQILVPLPDS